jgi:hypothetical protein
MSARARHLVVAVVLGAMLPAAPARAAAPAAAASQLASAPSLQPAAAPSSQPASAPSSQPATARASAPDSPRPALPLAAPSAPGGWWRGAQAKMGLILGVTGVGGLVLGTVYGLVARTRNNDALAHCRPDVPTLCDAVGVRLGDEAQSAARVSTASFVVGGALVATGVVLLFTQPRGERVAAAPRRALVPVVGPGVGAVMLQGGF